MSATTHKEHYIRYALDLNGQLVHVDNVPNGSKCGCRCPACNEPLIAKNNGTKKVHHFSHSSGKICEFAYETMLHLLAKERVQKAFLEKMDFPIKFEYKSYCIDNEACVLKASGSDCYEKSEKYFNLKYWYDSCKQEVPYKNSRHRSDLKIFSSTKPNTKPIYIEFCVSHASSEEKLHNGEHIIEIILNSESDISHIIENGFIEHNISYMNWEFYDYEENQKYPNPIIKFYNFKSFDKKNRNLTNRVEFVRYSLFKNGKWICKRDYRNCKNIIRRKDTLLDIHFHTNSLYEKNISNYAKNLGYHKFKIPNCTYCNKYVYNDYYNIPVCKWYKYLKIPFDKLDTEKAKTCPHFKLNQTEIKQQFIDDCDVEYTIIE